MKTGKRKARAGRQRLERRRRRVAKLRAAGRTVRAMADELRVSEATVHRDIRALRRAAARRDPWAARAACAAEFIEAAEEVLQKVRTAQETFDKKKPTPLYHNLVKLEWAMLVKFIEMTTRHPAATIEEQTDEEDYTRYTNEQLLRKAEELGIDVSGFERALRADPGARGEAA